MFVGDRIADRDRLQVSTRFGKPRRNLVRAVGRRFSDVLFEASDAAEENAAVSQLGGKAAR